MSDVKAKIRESSNPTSATVSTIEESLSTRTQSAFVIAKKLEEFTDINTTFLDDGSVLVYNEQRDEWDTLNELRAQSIDAGEF